MAAAVKIYSIYSSLPLGPSAEFQSRKSSSIPSLDSDATVQADFAITTTTTGKESVPIQLAQCRFPGLAISNAKI